jgi:hypothetical protein
MKLSKEQDGPISTPTFNRYASIPVFFKYPKSSRFSSSTGWGWMGVMDFIGRVKNPTKHTNSMMVKVLVLNKNGSIRYTLYADAFYVNNYIKYVKRGEK